MKTKFNVVHNKNGFGVSVEVQIEENGFKIKLNEYQIIGILQKIKRITDSTNRVIANNIGYYTKGGGE